MIITYVYGNYDWEAIYFDDVLQIQNHCITTVDLLNKLHLKEISIPIIRNFIKLKNEESNIINGNFPTYLHELKLKLNYK
jgi:hypothetical protein